MPLFSSVEILLMIGGATTGITAAYALFDARRARKRLENGQCSRCGKPWSAAYPDAERFLVSGREVCAPCASALRERLPRLVRRVGWVSVLGLSWLAYELGIQPLLNGVFSPIRLVTFLALPVAFGAATVVGLKIAARQNRLALGSAASSEDPQPGHLTRS